MEKNIRKKRILLFNMRAAPAARGAGEDDAAMALAPHFLKSWLLRDGRDDIEINIMTPPADRSIESIIKEIFSFAPDIAGFGCYVWNFETTLDITRRLRLVLPDVKIALGGPEIGGERFAAQVMKECPWIDVIAMGEGEEPFEAIVDDKMPCKNIPGISWRSADRIFSSSGVSLLKELASVPSFYTKEFLRGMPVVYYATSRGCVGRCSYCREWSEKRNLPIGRVEEELEIIFDSSDMKLFGFIDSVLDDDPARLRKILNIVARVNKRRIPVSAYFYFQNANEELFVLLEAAGFKYLRVGIESANPETLKRVGRGRKNISNIDKVLPYSDRFNIVPYIITHLPGETPDSFRENMKNCFRKGLLQYDFHCNRLNLYPGAPLYAASAKEGYVFDSRPPHHVYSSDGWSYEQFALDRAFLRNIVILGKIFMPEDEELIKECGLEIFTIANEIENESPGWKNAYKKLSSDTISDVELRDELPSEFERYICARIANVRRREKILRLFRYRYFRMKATMYGEEAADAASFEGELQIDSVVFILNCHQVEKYTGGALSSENVFVVGIPGERKCFEISARNKKMTEKILAKLAANRSMKLPLNELTKDMLAAEKVATVSLAAVLIEAGALCAIRE